MCCQMNTYLRRDTMTEITDRVYTNLLTVGSKKRKL